MLEDNLVLACIRQTSHTTAVKSIDYRSNIKLVQYKPVSPIDYISYQQIYHLRSSTSLENIHTSTYQTEVQCSLIQQQQTTQSQRFIQITTPFQDKENIYGILRKLQVNQNPQNFTQRATIINQVIVKLILTLMVSSNYQIYSDKAVSIFYEEETNDVQINVDQSSMAGMNLLLYDQDITIEQFQEIGQLLTLNIMHKNCRQRFNFSMKIRSIAKLLMQLIVGRKFNLLTQIRKTKQEDTDINQMISLQKCKNVLQTTKNAYQELLNNKTIIRMVENLQKQTKVNYRTFLVQTLAEERELSWESVISLILPKISNPHQKIQNIYTFQEMMAEFQSSRELSKGETYVTLLKQLGLQHQPKALFVALMSLKSQFAQTAICFQDLNDLLYSPNNYDFQVRDQLFNFISSILGEIADNRLILNSQKQQDYNNVKEFQQQQEGQQKYYFPKDKFGKPQTSNPPLQTLLAALNRNMGRFEMRIKKARFITQNYYAAGLNTLMNHLL